MKHFASNLVCVGATLLTACGPGAETEKFDSFESARQRRPTADPVFGAFVIQDAAS